LIKKERLANLKGKGAAKRGFTVVLEHLWHRGIAKIFQRGGHTMSK